MTPPTPALPTQAELDRLVARSIAVIVDGQADSGAFVAAPTFPTYAFSWLRDGAFIADAVDRHGRHDIAARFHRWAATVVTDRADQVADLVARAGDEDPPTPEEHLRARYRLDGSDDDGFWENFQLDGYGTWLWALRQHHDRAGTDPADHLAAVDILVPYLAAYADVPSYDWWEEHLDHRHVSTLASIWAGLDAVAGWDGIPTDIRSAAAAAAAAIAARIATDGTVDGSLVKWLGSAAVDASLIACLTPFGLHPPDHPVARRTVARVEAELAPAGVHRYLDDSYYGGGQWVLLAGFLAWHHLRAGAPDRAEALLSWIHAQADDAGDLPEQVADGALHPAHLPEWEARWGPSARPLLWSHAMFLDVMAEREARR